MFVGAGANDGVGEPEETLGTDVIFVYVVVKATPTAPSSSWGSIAVIWGGGDEWTASSSDATGASCFVSQWSRTVERPYRTRT